MEEVKEKSETSGKKEVTALEEYINKVYVLVCLLVPGACLCAGVSYTLAKFLGWIPSVSLVMLIIFDITCMIYFAIGVYFVRTGFKDGVVLPRKLTGGEDISCCHYVYSI